MTAVVFDFDHSLVEECSDLFVLAQLGRPGLTSLEHIRDRLKASQGWNVCMQEALELLFLAGVSRTSIEQAARRIPVFPHNLEIIRLAHEIGYACHIVSDANEI